MKRNSVATQGRIAYLILDIMRDKFVKVRIYKRIKTEKGKTKVLIW